MGLALLLLVGPAVLLLVGLAFPLPLGLALLLLVGLTVLFGHGTPLAIRTNKSPAKASSTPVKS